MNQRTFSEQEQVDLVIVGSGASGGVLAKELSTAGFKVVVLEQGPFRKSTDFQHDELGYKILRVLGPNQQEQPCSFRKTENETATVDPFQTPLIYARGVGGSSVHFTANYWRLHPRDFKERSILGPISGTGFADWPITYEELEPYYTKVDWEIGVSGAPGPFDPPRSRPYPMPPLPVKSSGVLFERGTRKLGLHPQPAPLAILSRPFNGRTPCQHCGYCMAFGCEFGAKSSTLVAMIPLAQATGRCEIRPNSQVFRVVTNSAGRVREVLYYDANGREHSQKARAFIIAGNGAETPRLLLLSASPQHPHGLANSSGFVGKHLMFNVSSNAFGVFEQQLNEYKSVQVTRLVHDFYDTDPKRGFYGGGGIDVRLPFAPIQYALNVGEPGAARWGADFKRRLHDEYTRVMVVAGHTTSLPLESNNITLDPTARDKFGLPGIRMTYKDHPDDLKIAKFLLDKSMEILHAAGARKAWPKPVTESTNTAHLLGTCRMGSDPRSSVVDKFHRTHDVRNLFICDGSSMVTSGRGQPTMTIQALAFRAAKHIGAFARRGEI
jgi:choline dehydrogenase-like flavoprotein